MLKYWKPDTKVVFAEFPGEVALAVNITNCPGHCANCSEPYLRQDIGEDLTFEEVDRLVEANKGITLFGLMGGDCSHNDVIDIARHIHSAHPDLKVGMYSGCDWLDTTLMFELDCYKIGSYISDVSKPNWGPLPLPQSNQLYFEKRVINGRAFWENATYKFRQKPINDYSRQII
jgi:anaerobic ribonucleoside-triphosphate reductase activating protein